MAFSLPAQAQLEFWGAPNQSLSIPDGRVLGSTVSNTETVTLGSVITSRTLTQEVFDPGSISGFSVSIYDGTYSISNPVMGASLATLIWGGSGDMNLDLASYGQAFQFSLLASDSGSLLSMSVWNGTTQYTAAPVTIPYYNGGIGSPDFTLAFADFGGADFTDVDRISFVVTSSVSADMTFSTMQVVPVPEASTAFLVGLVGMIALFRRRRA